MDLVPDIHKHDTFDLLCLMHERAKALIRKECYPTWREQEWVRGNHFQRHAKHDERQFIFIKTYAEGNLYLPYKTLEIPPSPNDLDRVNNTIGQRWQLIAEGSIEPTKREQIVLKHSTSDQPISKVEETSWTSYTFRGTSTVRYEVYLYQQDY